MRAMSHPRRNHRVCLNVEMKTKRSLLVSTDTQSGDASVGVLIYTWSHAMCLRRPPHSEEPCTSTYHSPPNKTAFHEEKKNPA